MRNKSNMLKVMTVFGTRPEAIKMAPVILELKRRQGLHVEVVVTGQHREMLDQALQIFDIRPDHDLDVMTQGQGLVEVITCMINRLYNLFLAEQPDLVLVHGDTSSTLAAGLAAFYAKVRIGHVEAGLRTRNMHSPWPEEMNRRLVAPITSFHFAPTEQARINLISEAIPPASIHVTGNTVIDALLHAKMRLESDQAIADGMRSRFSFLDPRLRTLLVTGHRRENFGDGIESICTALSMLAERNDLQIVYPVHMNPNVRIPVERRLSNFANIHLVEPLQYLPFLYLMGQSHVILTDSGGVQEEAPSLGIPVLVMRDTTERPEAVDRGVVKLVGTDSRVIVSEVNRLLDDVDAYDAMSKAQNPYGDGTAARKIADVIAGLVSL